jgi:hypothetical protein
MEFFASLIRSRGYLMTAGSDFHGKTKPLIELGTYPVIQSFQEDLDKSIQYIMDYEKGT